MNVLFCNRPDADSLPGGDTVQVRETKAALERLGHRVTLTLDGSPAVAGYDLVHVFNLQVPRSSLSQIQAAKRHGTPVAFSTIYWDMTRARRAPEALLYSADARVARLARVSLPLAVGLRRAWDGLAAWRGSQRRLLELADQLLPNSVAELEIVAREFGYPEARAKATIVPNAVRPAIGPSALSAATEAKLAGLVGPFVLEVARIEPVKGQLALIRARDRHAPELPLVFAGQAPPSLYAEAFQRRLDPVRTRFLGPLPREELPALYRRAKVHALPSLRESPGLATLEAALEGCRCLVGIHAPVEEYFGAEAFVCDPEDETSIGRALRGAWDAPSSDRLARRIRENFTWEQAAEKTLEGYRKIVGG